MRMQGEPMKTLSTVARLGADKGITHVRLEQEELDLSLGPHDVRIKVLNSSLNPHDLNVVLGRLPSKPGRVLLSDAVGTIESVGEEVDEFVIGDTVISCFFPGWLDGDQTEPGFGSVPGDGVDGYAAQFAVRDRNAFTKAPTNLSPAQAACLPTAGLTAWRALVVTCKIKSGDRVLVLGTGAVSLFAIKFATSLGASVIVTSSSDEKIAIAIELGASNGVNYQTNPEWGQAVLDLTAGKGVDHVLEIGGPGTLSQSITACRVGGNIVLIGVLTGVSGQIETARLMGKQLHLHGVTVGNRRQQQEMVRHIEQFQIEPVVGATFGLHQLRKAFEALSSSDAFGKIIVEM